MGLGNPGTKPLCHLLYKRLVVNGVTFDYIPACGLPTGFMDETVQDQTQSQGKQPPQSAQNNAEVQNYHSVESDPVIHVMANRLSPINTDSGTNSTKAIIEHSSTVTQASNRVNNPSSTNNTNGTESIIGSLEVAPRVRATHIIELSDEEDGLEVIAVIPSKRQVQENIGGGMKDSRTETNIHPKPHSQGTQDCPLEIESDSD